MGKVVKLRPQRHDVVAQALQLCLDLELSEQARDELAEKLGVYEPPTWGTYTMLNQAELRAVLKAIDAGPRPLATLKTWTAAVARCRRAEPGCASEIMATRQQLAEDAGLTPEEVSAGMKRLVEIGAVTQIRRGRYEINPHLAYNGTLPSRETAAKKHPRPSELRSIPGGKAPL